MFNKYALTFLYSRAILIIPVLLLCIAIASCSRQFENPISTLDPSVGLNGYTVQIKVLDSLTSLPAKDIFVKLVSGTEKQVVTDSSGVAVFDSIQKGTYVIQCLSSFIESKDTSITIHSDTLLSFAVRKLSDLPKKKIIIHVQDIVSHFPLRKISVRSGVYGDTITDSHGNCVFLLPPGNNEIITQNDYYLHTVTKIYVSSDSTVNISIQNATSSRNVHYIVYDASSNLPMQGVKIWDGGTLVEYTDSNGEAWMNYINSLPLTISFPDYDTKYFAYYTMVDTTITFYLNRVVLGDYWPFHHGDVSSYQYTASSYTASSATASSSAGVETWLTDSIYEDNSYYYYKIKDSRNLTAKTYSYGVLTDSQQVNDVVYFTMSENKSTHRLDGLPYFGSGASYYRYYSVASGDVISVGIGVYPASAKLQLNVGLLEVSCNIGGNNRASCSLKRIP